MVAAAATLTACSHAMMMIHGTGARRPAASEFGLGPRTSAGGRYVATLEPATPLRTRQMQTVRLIVRDAEGRAIDEAQISIDGGMPQHRHGLADAATRHQKPRRRHLRDRRRALQHGRLVGVHARDRRLARCRHGHVQSRALIRDHCHDEPHVCSDRTGFVGDDRECRSVGPRRVDERANRGTPIDVAHGAGATASRSHEPRRR